MQIHDSVRMREYLFLRFHITRHSQIDDRLQPAQDEARQSRGVRLCAPVESRIDFPKIRDVFGRRHTASPHEPARADGACHCREKLRWRECHLASGSYVEIRLGNDSAPNRARNQTWKT